VPAGGNRTHGLGIMRPEREFTVTASDGPPNTRASYSDAPVTSKSKLNKATTWPQHNDGPECAGAVKPVDFGLRPFR
jgi:hypothetical protein